jgi:hypothetical protein
MQRSFEKAHIGLRSCDLLKLNRYENGRRYHAFRAGQYVIVSLPLLLQTQYTNLLASLMTKKSKID